MLGRLSLVLLLAASTLVASENAKVLFESKCVSCHMTTMPTDAEFKTLVAPAIMGVMRHVKMEFESKEKAVDFIVDYVLEPSEDKAICMPKKIKRFGLMPSQKGNVSKEELEKIANYIYDNYPPANFKGKGKGNR